MTTSPRPRHELRAVGCGLFLMVFAAMAISGPGRIDIVDGQTRYEVARSIVDHGDHAVRDEHIWFGRFPGRDGHDYTNYRFPQSALGVLAILLSDATGTLAESRRHFFFSLTSAFAAASLSVLYLLWFARGGAGVGRAVFWSSAGIFCTPAWFYGTSTFDDILGTAAVVAAMVRATTPRPVAPGWVAIQAGLLVGLALNCKQPLGIFALPIIAAVTEGLERRLDKITVGALAVGGVACGAAVYLAYEAYKFPPGLEEARAALQLLYIPVWPGQPVQNLAVLALSPAAGVLWYCPPLILGVAGLRHSSRYVRLATTASIIVFVGFIASMTIFKGDPSWGPRYLTPVFGVLWLFAPTGAAAFGRPITVGLLSAGFLVQLAAVTVDPHRLYVERGLPSAFGAVAPLRYFDSANAHLVNRPREILEIWRARHQHAPAYSPSPSPTFAFPVLDFAPKGPEAIATYKVLNAFRPWWASHIYLPQDQRPVSILWGLVTQVSVLAVGIVMAMGPVLAEAARARTV